MAKIAFLGLGQMGAPMATRLLQAGHEVTVWNRTPDRAKPLAAAGATVARSPAEAGAGAAMKLVANLALGASVAAVGEALALGEALGRGRAPLLNMLEHSQLGPAVKAKRANIESGHYPPNFKLRHAAKDLRLVIEAADAVDRDLKVSAAARAWLDAGVEGGAADLDYSAVVTTIMGEEPKP